MKVFGLFVLMLISIGLFDGMDTPGSISIWHILLLTIVVFAAERLYVAFVLKKSD